MEVASRMLLSPFASFAVWAGAPAVRDCQNCVAVVRGSSTATCLAPVLAELP